jgi:hypothetical protein
VSQDLRARLGTTNGSDTEMAKTRKIEFTFDPEDAKPMSHHQDATIFGSAVGPDSVSEALEPLRPLRISSTQAKESAYALSVAEDEARHWMRDDDADQRREGKELLRGVDVLKRLRREAMNQESTTLRLTQRRLGLIYGLIDFAEANNIGDDSSAREIGKNLAEAAEIIELLIQEARNHRKR